MRKILVLGEHLRGESQEVTLELVSAGLELGGSISVAVISSNPASLTTSLNVAGVEEIIEIAVQPFERDTDVYQSATEALVAQLRPDVILTAFSSQAISYAAAVAVKLELGFASDVVALADRDGSLVAQRPFYAGKVYGELTFSPGRPVLLMLRQTNWAPATGEGSATVRKFAYDHAEPRIRHVQFIEPEKTEIDISTAKFLLSIGRGIGEKDNVSRLETLALKMGAVLSASRPLVDAGWVESERQVGQSGRSVQPAVYFALGISGASQHLAGIAKAGTIIAVNRDPAAAIFSVAHYAVVGDLFEVVAALEKLF